MHWVGGAGCRSEGEAWPDSRAGGFGCQGLLQVATVALAEADVDLRFRLVG